MITALLKHNNIKPVIEELTFTQLTERFHLDSEGWNEIIKTTTERRSTHLLLAEGHTRCLIYCGGESDTYKNPQQAAGLSDMNCTSGNPRRIVTYTKIRNRYESPKHGI